MSLQLNELRTFNTDGADLDELVELAIFGRNLRAEYEALQLEVPTWLNEQLEAIRREVRVRNEDARLKRIREIDSRIDALKSADERRSELLKEREKLVGTAKTSA